MAAQEVANGVYRLGTKLVNWYAIEEGGKYTLVDAGMVTYWSQLVAALRRWGKDLDDVEAVVLTHAHADHTGFAERARTDAHARVHVHEDDAAPGARKFPPFALFVQPTSWPLLLEGMRAGFLLTPKVAQLSTFRDGETLDVPGRPRVVHVPGHTAGSCALHVGERDVVFTGDALVTLDPYTRRTGPRLMLAGVNEDHAQARASLSVLAGLGAGVVLPGHGEPFAGGASAAVSAAQGRTTP